MADVFQPPPTWALPIIFDPVSKEAIFNPVWLKWFIDLTRNVGTSGAGLQTGWPPGTYGNVTTNSYGQVVSGHSYIDATHGVIGGLAGTTVITTAKLTGGGANGSMTFLNGVLSAQTPAT